MPNIVKNRQCFLELQLKMSVMYFLRHSVSSIIISDGLKSMRAMWPHRAANFRGPQILNFLNFSTIASYSERF